MMQRFEKIHIIICLFAALSVNICSIIYDVSLRDTALRLIFTIVTFYIIGSIVRAYLLYRIFPEEPVADTGGVSDISHDNYDEDNVISDDDAELITFDGSSDIDDET